MEHSIEFSMQKGKEWAYKNKYHILENQFIVREYNYNKQFSICTKREITVEGKGFKIIH